MCVQVYGPILTMFREFPNGVLKGPMAKAPLRNITFVPGVADPFAVHTLQYEPNTATVVAGAAAPATSGNANGTATAPTPQPGYTASGVTQLSSNGVNATTPVNGTNGVAASG